MPGHVSLDFMAVSSYAKGTTTSGEVQLLKDLDTALDGTQRHHRRGHRRHRPDAAPTCRRSCARAIRKSLRTACLLSKPSRRQVDVTVEYIGFTIEDRFVVGYGLDYAEQLPQPAAHRGVDPRTDPEISVLLRPRLATSRGQPVRVGDHRRRGRGCAAWRSRISTLPFTIVRPHVVAARDVDQVRHRIVERRLPRRARSRR